MGAPPRSRLDAVLFASGDPEALAEFYRAGFQLEAPRWHGEDHLGLSLSNTYLGFDRVDEPVAAGGSVTVWFAVPDASAAFERLLALGATEKRRPSANESPGEVLAIVLDPDGNALGLISPEPE
jgi:predicted enzyme related to lactoylglutathione lyase